MEDSDVQTHGSYLHGGHAVEDDHSAYRQYGHSFADYRTWRHNPALLWMKDHPFLCAAAVAAVVAIGPRRVARSVVSGGTALTALTLRNRANVDVLGRLLTTVVSYMQRERTRPPL